MWMECEEDANWLIEIPLGESSSRDLSSNLWVFQRPNKLAVCSCARSVGCLLQVFLFCFGRGQRGDRRDSVENRISICESGGFVKNRPEER